MSKISKINNNGTLSIVLPKVITDGRWEANTEVEIEDIDNGMAILISRNERDKLPIESVLDMMRVGSESFFELLEVQEQIVENSKGLIKPDFVEPKRRLKTMLIQLAQAL